MTDTGNEERPLTRRELRARERAAAAAAVASTPEADETAQSASEPAAEQPAAAEEAPRVEEPAQAEDSAQAEDPAQGAAVIEEQPDYTALQPDQPEEAPVDEAVEAEAQETQAYTIDDLRETGLVAEEEVAAEPVEADVAPEPAVEAPEETPAAPAAEAAEATSGKRGIGRFFGRRSRPETAEEPAADFDSLIAADSAPSSDDAAEEPAEGGIEDLEFADADQAADDAAADAAPEAPVAEEPVAAEPVEAEIVSEPEAAPSVDPAAETQEVAGPARAAGSRNVPLDQAQNLDAVRDEDVDSVEIDEVQVDERRISARTVSDSTPPQMDDTRGASFENDTDLPSGPSRGRGGRLPFVVNVVEDTSEHHISDLHRGRENVEGNNVGTGSSSITANALVLPATSQEDQIQFESEDGVLVTGSIDLPDGFASSGRARGAFDSADIDSSSDSSEVTNPETQPVRASRAVSSYANARVSIAPKRQSRSALPWALGIGGGVVFGAIVVVAVGFVAGWF
ncbi:hypothetical protein [Agrococcus casei]|uniref:Uncharacterized protein n=1 Tax=Agrococcus casei LMG 22410 TaxID=1255656 RepID=A0A1R4G681_9MICO|nr:hypothetical protein [Agrococcus casei]SJM63603.1 hypothetical protein CZ674_09100 [Agrococcus casei LMG 22410]